MVTLVAVNGITQRPMSVGSVPALFRPV